jgi:hypothetical protein
MSGGQTLITRVRTSISDARVRWTGQRSAI